MAFLLRAIIKLQRRPFTSATLLFTCLGGGAVAFTEADPSKQPDGPIGGLVSGGHGILRSSRAIKTFAVNSFDYKYTLLKSTIKGEGTKEDPEHHKKIKSEIHLRSAQRLLQLCEVNRGIYIKAGQFVASLQHLPKEYTTTLAVLQDQARFRPFKTIEKVLLEEFGASVTELFCDFEQVPIAAASLAQVHRAKLKDGREVAVKVQYPGLEKQVETDLKTMAVLSRAVGWLFPDYKFEWMVPEFEENLAQQLDFIREGGNAERTARNFEHKPELKVPQIYWDLTTRRVLTMEFMRGCKVDDVEAIKAQGVDPKQIARALVEVFAEMVFCHGWLHGDPHPGNLLVRADPESATANKFSLILLDHGLYKELDEEFRSDFCRLWKALILNDMHGVKEMGEKLGAKHYHRFLPVLFTGRPVQSKGGLGQGMTAEEARALRRELRSFSVGDLSSVVSGLPKDLFIVMRTDSLVRQIIGKLGAPPRMRLMTNAKYAVTGLALRHRGEPDLTTQGWPTYLKAKVDYMNLLLRLEVWQYLHSLHTTWEKLSRTALLRAWAILTWWMPRRKP